MNDFRKWLQGKKTYILLLVPLIIGVVEFFGVDVVPEVNEANALDYVWAALTGAAMRAGISSGQKESRAAREAAERADTKAEAAEYNSKRAENAATEAKTAATGTGAKIDNALSAPQQAKTAAPATKTRRKSND